MNRTFSALTGAADTLTAAMGEQAAASAMAEAMLTVATQPYPRRVLVQPGPERLRVGRSTVAQVASV